VRRADLLDEAARGRLPGWARATRTRCEHMERVAALMGAWAEALGLPESERVRWRAAGWLHDALRDAPPDELRAMVPAALRSMGGRVLHGPAAAARLRDDGVEDEALLLAIAYHTTGHPELDEMGRALFIADYIEPGRRYEPARLAVLRARMPAAAGAVLRDVLHARLERLLRERRPIRAETAAFWNTVNGGAAAGAAGDGVARPG
jgi:HD superfamily phosphohydrolase YqeK